MLPGSADPGGSARICTRCGLTRPLAHYHVKDRRTGRRFSQCKSCLGARQSEWAKMNKDKVAAASRRYYRANVESAADRRRRLAGERPPS